MGPVPLQQRAAGLMRVALSLLDEAGDKVTAAHLQTALDLLAGVETVEPDDALLRQAAVAADPSIVRAIGGALAVLGGVLEGKGIASMEEISNLLGIYAVITGETTPDEGLILAFWAGTLREAAQHRDDKKTQ